MQIKEKGTITRLLHAWRDGDHEAFNQLHGIIQEEILRLARSPSVKNRDLKSISTKTLIQETYLSLLEKRDLEYKDRKHFFCTAAMLMRRFLVDRVRACGSLKRGSDDEHFALAEWDGFQEFSLDLLLPINQALEKLQKEDPISVKVVELRFFAGFTITETAKILDIATITANRKWLFARTWLYQKLDESVL